MNDRCRLCSKKNVSLIEIFSSEGKKHNISGKIYSRLQIFIHEDDFLPKSVCYNCYGKLDMFDEFFKETHSTQTFLSKKMFEISASAAIKKECNKIIDFIEIDDDPPRNMVASEKRSLVRSGSRETDNHVPVIEFHSRDTSACQTSNCENRFSCNGLVEKTSSYNSLSFNPINKIHSPKNRGNENSFSTNQQENESDDSLEFEKTSNFENWTNFQDENSSVQTLKAPKNSPPASLASHGENEKGNGKKTPRANHRKKVKRKYFMKQTIRSTDRGMAGKRFLPVKEIKVYNEKSNNWSNQNTPNKIKTPQKSSSFNPYESSERNTQDIAIQAGNTLYSDLKNLKNTLLLKKSPLKNAWVHASNSFTNENFPDSSNDKGIQARVFLGTKHNVKNEAEYQSSVSLNKL